MYTKNKKIAAALTASVMTISCFSSMGSIYADDESSYSMNVSVNLSGEKKEISPYIYGVNQYTANCDDVKVNSIRQGGNRMTAYNWENNASNAGSDWHHSSDNNLSNSNDPADCVQGFSSLSSKHGIDYKLTTLQMAGYVSADKNGEVAESEAAPSDRWNKVEFRKNGELSLIPDLNDGVVYMDEYVNYIINKLGDSNSPTGMQGYSLDNEPALWNHTHSRMHPNPVGMGELSEKSIELAKVIKELDPDAEVFGPALYGYTAYDHLADDDSSNEWENIKSSNGYNWYIDYYLDDMKKASDKEGKRLLDVLDIHYYSESARVGIEDRLQSVRTLYEKGFAENSWIGQWCQQNIPILPTIQNSIDKYYPGTKLAISEYNFGGGDNVSGAIAQTEALGCYADEGVYFATLWGGGSDEPYLLSGINLYTNYDGEGSDFGDTLVEAKTEDVSLATAYASIDKNDDSNVTMVLSNKNMTATEKATISLDGTNTDYKSAVVYAITQDSSDIRIIDVQNDVSNNTVEVELPPMSVAQIVIADTETDKTIYEAPDITTKKTVLNYDELDTSENGFKMIPLGDKEHLKEIIVNVTANSSGGGALCFNNLVPEDGGDSFWGCKPFSYGTGTSDSVVKFNDMKFQNGDSEIIKSIVKDEYSELQNWWNVDDNANVKFNTITLVYEYDNTQPITTTTTEVTTETTTTTTSVTTGSSVIVDPNALYGDINVDDKISLSDVILLNKFIAGTYEPTEQGKANAACDQSDNDINFKDTTALMKAMLGLVQLPITE